MKPLVSVIIPTYNVEDYLQACLESVLTQDYPNFEVILVDDESTDNTVAIANEYSRTHDNVRVVRQKNGGPGAARNRGLRYAKGKYITFVDSDDTLPKRSFRKLMKMLIKSNSDFIVGTTRKVSGRKKWIPEWATRVHDKRRVGITIDEYPDALMDILACNRIYKKKFFLKHIKRFPTDSICEDREPAAQAYLSSKSFDMTEQVTYNWLVREDGSSRSQQKNNENNLKNRFQGVLREKKIYRKRASTEVYNRWLEKAFGFDLRQYIVHVPYQSETYWSILKAGVRELMDSDTPPLIWEKLDITDRCLLWAIYNDSIDDVKTITAHIEMYSRNYSTKVKKGEVLAKPAYYSKLKKPIPKQELLVNAKYLTLQTKIYEIRFDDESLCIVGSAFINDIPNKKTDTVNVSLRSADQKHVITANRTTSNLDTNKYETVPNIYVDHNNCIFSSEFSFDHALLDSASMWLIEVTYISDYGEHSSTVYDLSQVSQTGYRQSSDNSDSLESYTFTRKYVSSQKRPSVVIGKTSVLGEPLNKYIEPNTSQPPHVIVDELKCEGSTLHIKGAAKSLVSKNASLNFVSEDFMLEAKKLEIKNGTFVAVYELHDFSSLPTKLNLQVSYGDTNGVVQEKWVPVSMQLNENLPRLIRSGKKALRISRTAKGGTLHLRVLERLAEQ